MAAPKNANIQNQILLKTAELLKSNSFAEISLGKIAAAADISKGTLYYYYNNKEDILFDLTDKYLGQLADRLEKWLADPEKDTSYRRLVRYILREAIYDESGNLRLFLNAAAVSHDSTLNFKVSQKYNTFSAVLSEAIAERRPTQNANYIAWLLLSTMDGLLVQKQLGNPLFNIDEFIEQTADLLESL